MEFTHKSGTKHVVQSGSNAARRFEKSKDYKLTKDDSKEEPQSQPKPEPGKRQ